MRINPEMIGPEVPGIGQYGQRHPEDRPKMSAEFPIPRELDIDVESMPDGEQGSPTEKRKFALRRLLTEISWKGSGSAVRDEVENALGSQEPNSTPQQLKEYERAQQLYGRIIFWESGIINRR